MHWNARREQWIRPRADEGSTDATTARDLFGARSGHRHDCSPDASRLQLLPGVNLTQVLSSLALYGRANPGEMTFSDFEKAYRHLFGTTVGVAAQFMQLRDEEISALRNEQSRAAPRADHHTSESEFGVVLVDDFHSWIRGQATAVGAERTVRAERPTRSRSRSSTQGTPPRVLDLDIQHRTVRAERPARSRSRSPASRETQKDLLGGIQCGPTPWHSRPQEYTPSVEPSRSFAGHSTTLKTAGRKISEHHVRSFETAQEKAVEALRKGVTQLQGRYALRYSAPARGEHAALEANGSHCQLTICNEATSHQLEHLQGVRSKLLWLASVATAPSNDWSPQHFFREIEETGRGVFEKLRFVHAVQSAFSEAAAEHLFSRDAAAHRPIRGEARVDSGLTPATPARIGDVELVELFTALDAHGTGVVPVEALESFVFGGGDRHPLRQRQEEPKWHYPFSHGRLDTTPRTLQLDLSMSAGPPALLISWRSQDVDPAETVTGAHARAKKPTTGLPGACCAAPEHRHSRRALSTAVRGTGAEGGAEHSVRVVLSDIRAVIFGAATGLTRALDARTFDHWNSFSVCTQDVRWDFASAAARDARSCFLAIQAVLVSRASPSMERLWGRILWHSARARFRTLAAELKLPLHRTMSAIVAHPKQPSRRKPIDRMRHQTLADLHLKQRSQAAEDQSFESDWVDGSRFSTSSLPTGVCVDVEGYGCGEVISTSADALDEPVHTIKFKHDSTGNKTLKLQHRAVRQDHPGSGLHFLVEVARLR